MVAPDARAAATSEEFAKLLDAVRGLEAKFDGGANGPLDDQELIEAYKWAFSILQVGLDVYMWADTGRPRFVDIVGPYKKWGGDNADAYYQYAPIDPARTYRVRGRMGDAVYASLTVYGGPDDGRYSERIVGTINDRDLDIGPDGEFEFLVSPDQQLAPGVTLEPDAVCAITRDYLEDPVGGRRVVWEIEAVDAPATYRESDADLARRLRAARTWVEEQAKIVPLALGEPNSVDEPYPVPAVTYGWAAGDAAYAMGSFDLADDEALVIHGRSPECAFWNVCLWNRFLHTYNYEYERVTINGAQIVYDDDGSWTIVIAGRDPGHANWVSTSGHRRGRIWFRWFHPSATPERPTTRVVSVAEAGITGLMGERPQPVRLDDLADPQFSPEAREIFSMMAPMAEGVRLEPDALCDLASADTGMDDFGDPAFREPLAVLGQALRTEAGLGAVGTFMVQQQLLGLLKNRLRVEDLLRRHPEIHDVVIDRPIIIAGLPRTGTTHLHNLMSADPALRSLPYWESVEPVLAESERPGPGEPDPRRARTEQGLGLLDVAMPHFKRMHEMTVDHVHEEIQLLAIAFSTMLFETMAVMPSWRDWYQSHDQTPAYEYMRTVLKAMQWLRGGDRWVLKSPQHLEQFGPLVATFPDATFVVTHRDPVAVTTSLVTMMSYSSRLNLERPDPVQIGAYWAARVEEMLNACVRDRHLLPAARSIDVRFDEFMADDVAMVERIYGVAGQPMTDAARKAMDDFMADHPRGRHGTVVYDLEQFGLDAGERHAALAAYALRFSV